jgi:pimeloyl-ACP methyl ester carboxylesterase
MSPVEVVPAETGCNETSGSLRPDALVTLAGAVDLDEDGPGHQQFLRGFFDGSRQDRPGRWREADPFALATLAEHPDVAITVVHGTGDVTVAPEVSRRFVAALGKNGYRSDLVEVPDADHLAILAAPATTDAIVAALDPG